jgi:D-glycerate 3-kinase
VYLDVGNLDRVLEFRAQQEQDLPAAQRMSPAQMARFVAHYERLTRWMQVDLPGRADVTVTVADGHRIDPR